MSKHKWIQKAVKGMRQDKPCTGAKFGSSSCPPGSKRYNLAKTFKAMARGKKADGGCVGCGKYPFGGAINKGVTSLASSLGLNPKVSQLLGSGISTLTGFIPGFQDNLLQGADLLGDIGTATGQQELQKIGEFGRPVADIAGLFTGDTGNILGKFNKVPIKRHGGDPRYAQFHNLSQEDYDKAIINVEKDELEVKQGKVLTDYRKKPRHPDNEAKIDIYGNTLATPGNIIVPKDKREAYIKGDKITRNTIETQLRRDQNKRERAELGTLRKDYTSRQKFLQELRTDVQDYLRKNPQTEIRPSYNQSSVFPEGYGVGFEDLITPGRSIFPKEYVREQGGNVIPEFLYNARGRAMRKANPQYFKHGGLSRKEDYGSSRKPYPSVKSSDFAGSGRSYPIPSKADAIDALRLAGLHGRADIRAKVFKRYPELKKRHGGKILKYQGGAEIAPAYKDEFGYENYLNSQLANYYGKSQAVPSTYKYSPAIGTTNTQFDPFYNPGTANFRVNKPISPGGENGSRFGFSDFAQYIAPAYNIGMGLFGKTPEVETYQNPYTQRIKDIMNKRSINMEPVFRDIESSEAGARRQLRGLTGGSAGLQLSNLGTIQNIAARNKAQARMQEQIANIGFRGEEAQTLDILGQQDVQAREKQRQLELALGSQQAQFIPKGLEQISAIPQLRNRDAILKEELKRRIAAVQASGNQQLVNQLIASL